MRTLKTRTAGEVGSWKYRMEWELAKSITGYDERIQVTEVPIKVDLGNGRVRHDAVLRYEADGTVVGPDLAKQLAKLVHAYADAWYTSHYNAPKK